MSGSVRTLIEDTKLEVNNFCGVGKKHFGLLGCSIGSVRICPDVCRDTKIEEKLCCGLGEGHRLRLTCLVIRIGICPDVGPAGSEARAERGYGEGLTQLRLHL